MDCIVHGVAKSWTQLSDLHFQYVKTKTQNINLPLSLKKERERKRFYYKKTSGKKRPRQTDLFFCGFFDKGRLF